MKKNSIARKTALAGCIQNQTSSFTRATSTMVDINLTQDTWHSRYIDQIAVPTALQHLPNISGMGRLRDLQQAAVLSPTLASALEQYTAVKNSIVHSPQRAASLQFQRGLL